jgi:acetyl-CoA carboxylase biotin carboxyl carrier protein
MAITKIESEISGLVWKLEVKPGDAVASDQVLMILESMKMEIPVQASCAGTVQEIRVNEGEAVTEGQVLVVLA